MLKLSGILAVLLLSIAPRMASAQGSVQVGGSIGIGANPIGQVVNWLLVTDTGAVIGNGSVDPGQAILIPVPLDTSLIGRKVHVFIWSGNVSGWFTYCVTAPPPV